VVDRSRCLETAWVFYFIKFKIMVSKIFSDEHGNDLELFINTKNEFVIKIKNGDYDYDFKFICLDKTDLEELKNEIDILLHNL
jgi:hypothetical protein